MTREVEVPFPYLLEMHAGWDLSARYLRSWGFEFLGICEVRAVSDPFFAQALRAAHERVFLLALSKLANLSLIISDGVAEDAGDISEFGSLMGGSAVFMGVVSKGLGRQLRVLAFDAYEGMLATDVVRHLLNRADFGETGDAGLLHSIEVTGLSALMQKVKGGFSGTLLVVASQGGKVWLLRVACDNHESIRVVRAGLPHIAPAGYVMSDAPTHGFCLGASDALQELSIREFGLAAESAHAHLMFRCPQLAAA